MLFVFKVSWYYHLNRALVIFRLKLINFIDFHSLIDFEMEVFNINFHLPFSFSFSFIFIFYSYFIDFRQ